MIRALAPEAGVLELRYAMMKWLTEPTVSCTALEPKDRHVFGNVRATILPGKLENKLIW
jgi:hypothetical protein